MEYKRGFELPKDIEIPETKRNGAYFSESTITVFDRGIILSSLRRVIEDLKNVNNDTDFEMVASLYKGKVDSIYSLFDGKSADDREFLIRYVYSVIQKVKNSKVIKFNVEQIISVDDDVTD
ncbi:hypothetical protein UFOVP671_29 [uncultured Caudovirales phage]|uniref:Uncharacterized protein n=1 Tax=uncultured Caudovirales phage TaxID=2100421 RepID=A0A6J5NFY1_9CAUD|nr:hypothetical protein UFOVP671_29 [uncultured Caudovirales phage]